MGNFYKIEQA